MKPLCDIKATDTRENNQDNEPFDTVVRSRRSPGNPRERKSRTRSEEMTPGKVVTGTLQQHDID